MKDRVTKQPRGFGFVTFASPDAAQQAVQQGPHSIDDRMVRAERGAAKHLVSVVGIALPAACSCRYVCTCTIGTTEMYTTQTAGPALCAATTCF